MASDRSTRRRWPLRTASTIAVLITLLATAAAVWGAHTVVSDQEKRLLNERASEVSLVLTSAIDSIPAGLSSQGVVLTVTGGSRAAYHQAAQAAVEAGPGELTFAWLRPALDGHGYEVLDAAGTGLHRGEVVNDARTQTFDAAMKQTEMVATPVIGAERKLGFALGPPAAPPHSVLYRETALGPLAPPRAASTAPFSELDVAIYGTPSVHVAQALSATTPDLPLTGDVRRLPLEAGASHWLLEVKARQPLVGQVATNAWWVALLVGLAGTVLIAVAVETAARRRDAALALYESEHQVAETLQRSLLPRLPHIPGLELAARYLAGGQGQQVGGDWFDAFPVSGGRVGIAVGDVIGHDVVAASAMAQIRAALRAYAIDGAPPEQVINRLDHLVEQLGLTQLVTVVYGLLEPPAADGSRLLTHTNAGHLAPLVRTASGEVSTLTAGESVVIGAPITFAHTQVEQRLEAGSTLLLFTDGLVEVPGGSIEDKLGDLSATLAETDVDDLEALCDRIIGTTADRPLRDDVALLVIRMGDRQRTAGGAAATDAPELGVTA